MILPHKYAPLCHWLSEYEPAPHGKSPNLFINLLILSLKQDLITLFRNVFVIWQMWYFAQQGLLWLCISQSWKILFNAPAFNHGLLTNNSALFSPLFLLFCLTSTLVSSTFTFLHFFADLLISTQHRISHLRVYWERGRVEISLPET